MMRSINILALSAVGVTSCTRYQLADEEILARCWNAVPVRSDTDEYRIQISAIVIPAIEGGVYARTSSCPQYRLKIDYTDPAIQSEFEKIADNVAPRPILGAGIRADVQVKIKQRRSEFLLTVTVTRLLSLHSMNLSDTQRFISDFDIE